MAIADDFKVAVNGDVAKRFWSHVAVSGPGDCWLWQASCDNHGYGQMNIGGNKGRPFRAHRIAYAIKYGAVPHGVCVLHKCDVPACVNPDHLFLGTQQDNLADMRRKGRQCIGSSRSFAKLNEELVVEIRRRYKLGGVSQAELATRYGVCQTAISELLRGISWKHVGGVNGHR